MKSAVVWIALALLIIVVVSSLSLMICTATSTVTERREIFTAAVTNTLLPAFNAPATTVLGYIFAAAALRAVAIVRGKGDGGDL